MNDVPHLHDVRVVTPKGLFDAYSERPGFPHLISYPRCGGHYLRAMLELCMRRPGLREVFCYFDSQDYTHVWDHSLPAHATVAIILYRANACHVVHSMLRKVPPTKGKSVQQYMKAEVSHRAREYQEFLSWVLFDQRSLKRRALVEYEALVHRGEGLARSITLLGGAIDQQRVKAVRQFVTKEWIESKTPEFRVVDRGVDRLGFEKQWGHIVRTHMAADSRLESYTT